MWLEESLGGGRAAFGNAIGEAIGGLEFFAAGPIARRGGKRYFPAPIGVWSLAHKRWKRVKLRYWGVAKW
jgi:hypothetical protein